MAQTELKAVRSAAALKARKTLDVFKAVRSAAALKAHATRREYATVAFEGTGALSGAILEPHFRTKA
jgi:hypothetical protein